MTTTDTILEVDGRSKHGESNSDQIDFMHEEINIDETVGNEEFDGESLDSHDPRVQVGAFRVAGVSATLSTTSRIESIMFQDGEESNQECPSIPVMEYEPRHSFVVPLAHLVQEDHVEAFVVDDEDTKCQHTNWFGDSRIQIIICVAFIILVVVILVNNDDGNGNTTANSSFPTATPTVATLSPTRQPVMLSRACQVCGDGRIVGNPDEIFSFAGLAVPCWRLEQSGLSGLIPPKQCQVLPNLIGRCGCVKTTTEISYGDFASEPCSICGEGLRVGDPNGTVTFPGKSGPSISCQTIEDGGFQGFIDPSFCPLVVPLVFEACLCRPLDVLEPTADGDPAAAPTTASIPNPTNREAPTL